MGGATKDAANLSKPHGISIDATDPRGPLVWVPSRSQSQIKAFTLDGTYVDTIDLPGTFAGQLVSRDDMIYTAVWLSQENGTGKKLNQSGSSCSTAKPNASSAPPAAHPEDGT